MDCNEFKLTLDLLIDGEISQEEKEKALKHIEGCEKCKEEYERALALKRSFESFVEKSDRSLADSVVAKIRKERYGEKKTPFFVRHMGLVASLLFIGAIALYTGAIRNNSDMYISEESASVADADRIFDIKNSADIKTDDVYFTAYDSSFEETEAVVEESTLDSCTIPFNPEATAKPEAPVEEATASEPLKSASKDSAVVKISCDAQKILPLLTDYEIIEYGEDYIVVSAEDKEKIEEIIKEM